MNDFGGIHIRGKSELWKGDVLRSQEDNTRNSSEQPYIRETIVKPKKRWRFFSYLLTCLSGGLLFGAIACASFIWLYPKISPLMQPMGSADGGTVDPTITLPTYAQPEETTEEETEEPSEGISETDSTGAPEDLSPSQQAWIQGLIQQMMQSHKVDLNDLNTYAKAMSDLYDKMEKSLASIVAEDEMLDPLYQEQNAACGMIFSKLDQTREVYILTTMETLERGSALFVKFTGISTYYEATVKGQDELLGLVVLSVQFSEDNAKQFQNVQPIELGNNYLIKPMSPVFAVGEPLGKQGSVAFGTILRIDRDLVTYDTVFRMFYADIMLPESGTGFLMNTEGKLIGIISKKYADESMQGYLSAIGTEEISRFLSNMANGITSSYFGIMGQNVTAAVSEQTGMPQGVYVTEVAQGSPAYLAGISNGDVIVAISTGEVTKMSQLMDACASKRLPGESVIITVMRKGKTEYKQLEFTVTLGQRK